MGIAGRQSRGAAAVCCALVLLAPGCFGTSDGPRTAPVRGTVTMNGKPMAGVGVTFFPTGHGPMATGNTNEKGEFVLMTNEPGDGASIGTHRVTLGNAEEGRAPAVPVPDRYGMPDTSGLTADVKEDEDNVFSFELMP
jgi:hypothetical protein